MPMGHIEYVKSKTDTEYNQQYYKIRKEPILQANREYWAKNREEINRRRREKYVPRPKPYKKRGRKSVNSIENQP